MSILYIDIETIPTQREDIIQELRMNVAAPANYTKPESIQKWLEENGEEAFQLAYRKTALDGLYGEIISIAWAWDDEFVEGYVRDLNQPEQTVIESFFADLNFAVDDYGNKKIITTWCGHNICDFDLLFLWQRCVVNGIYPSVVIPYDAKPWDMKVFDTLYSWKGGNTRYQGRAGLDALAHVFGILQKGELSGANVWDYARDGRYDEILQYNKDDVERVREIYKRMTFKKAA